MVTGVKYSAYPAPHVAQVTNTSKDKSIIHDGTYNTSQVRVLHHRKSLLNLTVRILGFHEWICINSDQPEYYKAFNTIHLLTQVLVILLPCHSTRYLRVLCHLYIFCCDTPQNHVKSVLPHSQCNRITRIINNEFPPNRK